MGTIVQKIADLEFNELITLEFIENDSDLTEIFKDDIAQPFDELYQLSKDDNLPENVKEMVFGIFDKIIVTKKQYVEKYKRLFNSKISSEQVMPQVMPQPIIEKIQKEVLELILPEVIPQVIFEKTRKRKIKIKEVVEEVIIEKTKKPKIEIPRRYGVKEVLKDIEKQDGKATSAQLTFIELNDLKNLEANLLKRLIKDMTLGTSVVSEEDHRSVRSTIKIIKNKWRDILRKK